MATIWVQAVPGDRKVLISEYDEQHPGNHEAWLVAYPDPRFDADGNPIEPANPPIEVGDTALVRRRIAEKVLRLVDAPMSKAQRAALEKERAAAEKAEADRLAAEAAARAAAGNPK